MAVNGIDFCEVVTLVADPEPAISSNGKSRARLRFAYNPRERDRQSGEYKDGETTWIGGVAFGELGDNVVQSLSKGQRVLVKGRLTTSRYQDNSGNDREGFDLVVDAIGPELRFSVAQVSRSGGQRTQPPAQHSNSDGGDPWGQQSGNSAQGGFGGGDDFGSPF